MNEILLYNDANEWRRIHYTIDGENIPATFDHEAEYPIIEIWKILSCDDEGNDIELKTSEEYDQCMIMLIDNIGKL